MFLQVKSHQNRIWEILHWLCALVLGHLLAWHCYAKVHPIIVFPLTLLLVARPSSDSPFHLKRVATFCINRQFSLFSFFSKPGSDQRRWIRPIWILHCFKKMDRPLRLNVANGATIRLAYLHYLLLLWHHLFWRKKVMKWTTLVSVIYSLKMTTLGFSLANDFCKNHPGLMVRSWF